MAKKEKHSPGIEKGKFCAVRTKPHVKCTCDSPNGHIKNSGITGDFFVRGSKKRKEKKFEAHHLLCIASVTEFLGKDPAIGKIVEKTRWCINAKKNMLGMPLWGHTIKHYCDLSIGSVLGKPEPPWFENIPMHNYNHNGKGSYKSEVDNMMSDLASDILQLADEDHDDPEKELAGLLNSESDSFRSLLLDDYGKRVGGTHAAWKKGGKDQKSDWYKPFSMADSPDPREFPAKGINDDSYVANKLAKLAKSFKKWGA